MATVARGRLARHSGRAILFSDGSARQRTARRAEREERQPLWESPMVDLLVVADAISEAFRRIAASASAGDATAQAGWRAIPGQLKANWELFVGTGIAGTLVGYLIKRYCQVGGPCRDGEPVPRLSRAQTRTHAPPNPSSRPESRRQLHFETASMLKLTVPFK